MDDRLKEVLGRVFDIPAEEIDERTSPENVGLWDSLNHLKMVSEIEKTFNMRFTMKEIRSMATYGKIREVVFSRLEGNKG